MPAELCTKRELDLAAGERLQRGAVRRVDDQPVGLQLGEEPLARRDTAEVVHHPGDERVGRARLGRVVRADRALPLRAEQLLPGRGGSSPWSCRRPCAAGQRDAGRHVALVRRDVLRCRGCSRTTLGSKPLHQQALLVEAGEGGRPVDPEQAPVRIVLRRLDLGQQRTGRVVVEPDLDAGRLGEGRRPSPCRSPGRSRRQGVPSPSPPDALSEAASTTSSRRGQAPRARRVAATIRQILMGCLSRSCEQLCRRQVTRR